MPDRTKVTGPDGKQYYEVPGMSPIPVEDVDGPPKEEGMLAKAGGFIKRASPEIVGGLSAALAPETGFASLAIPPLAAGATEALKQWSDTGSVDPMAVATRAGLNAIPGGLSKIAGRFLPGSGTLTRAVEGAAQGDSWIGTIAKGLKGAMGGQATPAVQIAQAGGKANAPSAALIAQLEQKLTDPSLNTTAKAAVLTALKRLQGQQSGRIAQGLRGAMGLTQGVAGEQ